jgi:hypothetical protein
MKFKLSLTGNFYKENEIKKYEELGFEFEKLDGVFLGDTHKLIDLDENGEWLVSEIEINTIDELIKFVEKYGKIIFWNDKIEIYNDYRE